MLLVSLTLIEISWLPTVAGGGGLNFNLRFYNPTLALTNGSYLYPTIEQIEAVR